MKDIGSIYPIDSVVAGEGGETKPGCRTEMNVRLFSLCREGLSAIARVHSGGKKRVLLPAYTCRTVVDPFRTNGWTCAYFGLGLDLRINIASLEEQYRALDPDVVVVHPYYGMDLDGNELAALRKLKTSGKIFVEDLTQGVFSTAKDDVFDYYTGSLRKWFPMPDGAFVTSDKYSLGAYAAPLGENSRYLAVELSAMYLRGKYFDEGDTRVKEISREVDKAAQAFICDDADPHDMSAYSRSVVANADIDALRAARERNFKFLFENLHNPSVTKICYDLVHLTTTPLYFPVLVRNRAELLARLIPERVYALILWPIPNEDVLVDDATRTLYDSILAIPIDQRYDVDDMRRIIDIVDSVGEP